MTAVLGAIIGILAVYAGVVTLGGLKALARVSELTEQRDKARESVAVQAEETERLAERLRRSPKESDAQT